MENLELWKFNIIDFIDVFLVAILMYYIYKLVKGTVAVKIFIGILIIYLVFRTTDILEMRMLNAIFKAFIEVGIIALIVVFQPEIRKFLLMVGSTNIGGKKRLFKNFKFLKNDNDINTNVDAIIAACNKFGISNTGALIVLERQNNLDFLNTTGDEMNILVSQPILESIFYKNSPLHDGAIIIADNVIKATRVILPVSNEKNIPDRFGLRHRAAIGITEKTDALAITVSEETGQISYIKNGNFINFKNTAELIKQIKTDLS